MKPTGTGRVMSEAACCQGTRLNEAGAWMDTVTDLQEEVGRLRQIEERRNAMLALHCGYSEGDQPMTCGQCGAWPCTTYLACYPEAAWSTGEADA